MDDRKLKARAVVKVQKERNMSVSSYCVFIYNIHKCVSLCTGLVCKSTEF